MPKKKGRDVSNARGAAVFLIACFGALFCAAGPKVVWWSDPVEPGETVEVFGADFGNAAVTVAGRSVPVVMTTATGLWFKLPADLKEGLAEVRISGGGKSSTFTVNAPQVKWMQGHDGGEVVYSGDVLRLFGRCLRRKGTFVTLGGKPLELAYEDEWSVSAEVPADFPVGEHEVRISNGEGGAAGWRSAGKMRVTRRKTYWKTDVFNVADFGAKPSDHVDDTAAFKAALAAAGRNGGGIVQVPPGRFQLREAITIPPRTLLKGTGRQLSSVYWPDTDYPPEGLINATSDFGIEDIFFHSGFYQCGLLVDHPKINLGYPLTMTREVCSSNIVVRRCTFDLVSEQYLGNNYDIRAVRHGDKRGRSRGLLIRGSKNVVVEDCDLYVSRGMTFILSGDDFRVSRCRFRGESFSAQGGRNFIFEDNDGVEVCFSISTVSRNFFFGRNRQGIRWGGDRECVTHDSSQTAFRLLGGGLVGVTVPGVYDGKSVVVEPPKDGWYKGQDYWYDSEIQIVTGRGAGQTRHVVAIEPGNRVVIDSPFTIAPDATSRYEVGFERHNLLYVDNESADAGIGIQLYGGCTDVVVARNRTRRTGGLIGFGHNYHSIVPMWFAQFIGNTIEEGNSCRGPAPDSPYLPIDAWVGSVPKRPEAEELTRATVLRRNVLKGGATLTCATLDGLVEGNSVAHANRGIWYAWNSNSVYEANNRFEDIGVELPNRRWTHTVDGFTLWRGTDTTGPGVKVKAKNGKVSVTDVFSDAKVGDVVTAVAHLRLGRTSLFTWPGGDWDSKTYFTRKGEPLNRVPEIARIPRIWPAGEYELRFVKTLSHWRTGNWIFDGTFGCSGKTNELETLVNME